MAHDPALLSSILCFYIKKLVWARFCSSLHLAGKHLGFYDCCNSFQLLWVANTIFLSVSSFSVVFNLIKVVFLLNSLA